MIKKYSNGNILFIAGIAVLVSIFSLFTSCEKEVDINLDTGEPKIVIEGGIENDLPPIVFITKSIGYFQAIDLATLQNSSVHNAEVYVSDGIKKVRLKEYAVDTGGFGA